MHEPCQVVFGWLQSRAWSAFCDAVQVTAGLCKGDTVLPLPVKSEAISDKDFVHLLEGAFVTWTRQIKEVLKVDVSASLLVRNLSPGRFVMESSC